MHLTQVQTNSKQFQVVNLKQIESKWQEKINLLQQQLDQQRNPIHSQYEYLKIEHLEQQLLELKQDNDWFLDQLEEIREKNLEKENSYINQIHELQLTQDDLIVSNRNYEHKYKLQETELFLLQEKIKEYEKIHYKLQERQSPQQSRTNLPEFQSDFKNSQLGNKFYSINLENQIQELNLSVTQKSEQLKLFEEQIISLEKEKQNQSSQFQQKIEQLKTQINRITIQLQISQGEAMQWKSKFTLLNKMYHQNQEQQTILQTELESVHKELNFSKRRSLGSIS